MCQYWHVRTRRTSLLQRLFDLLFRSKKATFNYRRLSGRGSTCRKISESRVGTFANPVGHGHLVCGPSENIWSIGFTCPRSSLAVQSDDMAKKPFRFLRNNPGAWQTELALSERGSDCRRIKHGVEIQPSPGLDSYELGKMRFAAGHPQARAILD
jgi:hypothetical protein